MAKTVPHLPSDYSATISLTASVGNYITIGVHREQNVNEC